MVHTMQRALPRISKLLPRNAFRLLCAQLQRIRLSKGCAVAMELWQSCGASAQTHRVASMVLPPNFTFFVAPGGKVQTGRGGHRNPREVIGLNESGRACNGAQSCPRFCRSS